MKRFCVRLKYALSAGLLAAAILIPAAKASGGSNWPQWRGPESQGISTETNLPTEWSSTKNVQWKTAVPGRGHSSPIVWEKRLFLTTSIEGAPVEPKPYKHMMGKEEFKHPDWAGSDRSYAFKVLCFDTDTGKMLWEKTAYEGPVFDHRHKKNTYASPTPTTDGKYVYAYFGSEGLYCYDFDGKQVWKTSLGGIPQLGMGAGTSPVLFENLIILQCDVEGGEGSYITALDKKTGKQVWKTERKNRASWATPILVKTAKRTELIASGAESVIAYDPATGKELWRYKGVDGHAIPNPVSNREMVFVSAGFPAKKAIALKLGASGDLANTPNVVWEYAKGTAYVPSPILYQDYLYLMTDRGILTCLEAKTGAVKYEGGRIPVPATFTASPIAFEGKILLTSEDGDTYVLKAGPSHEVIQTNSLGEPVYASPAVANGKIYIRGDKHLYCISNKAAK